MEEILYGVDLSKKVTPIMARDALIKCFLDAHKEVLEQMKEFHEFRNEAEFDEMKKMNVEVLVRKKFDEIGAPYNNPTKKQIAKVCEKVAEYANNFRKKDIVQRHYDEMKRIVSACQD